MINFVPVFLLITSIQEIVCLMSRHVALLCRVVSRCVSLCLVVSRCVALCLVVSRHVALLCRVMSRFYVASCRVMSRFSDQSATGCLNFDPPTLMVSELTQHCLFMFFVSKTSISVSKKIKNKNKIDDQSYT
jgi:hypothetical protein